MCVIRGDQQKDAERGEGGRKKEGVVYFNKAAGEEWQEGEEVAPPFATARLIVCF